MKTAAHTNVPTPERLQVSLKEAAHMLSISRSSLYTLLKRGELHSTGRGRLRRIPTASLKAYIERQARRN